MKQTSPLLSRPLLCLMIAAIGIPAPALSAPLLLSTAPPGTSFRPPAPNVIVSVDDSGSMSNGDMTNLRTALAHTFAASNVADDQIRLAWQSMGGCRGIPNAGASCGGLNGMRSLSGSHRTNFLDWVASLAQVGGTPSHLTMRAAGEYLRTASPTDVNGPWASKPGSVLEPVLSCRRSYHLFMTDGEWNQTAGAAPGDGVTVGVGNTDGTTTALPDGTLYDTAAADTRLYRDTSGSASLSTFSDLAFHYWATDLQPGIPNDLKPKINRSGTETFTNAGTSHALAEYWNPRNNPATWQHLTTYTIGYRNAAVWGSSQPLWDDATNDNFAGGLPGLVTGTHTWQDPIPGNASYRRKELWHAALNTRGRFVPAPDAQTLVTAFQDILNEVVKDNTKPLTSIGVSSQQLRENAAAFISGYDAASWSGQVTAQKVDAATGSLASGSLWGSTVVGGVSVPVTTATLIDARTPASRKILTSHVTPGMTPTPITFDWAALSSAQKALFSTVNYGGTTDALGAERLAYIRGDRSKEVAGGSGSFRDRASALGDIVNSQIWYVGQPSSGYRSTGYASFRSTHANRTPMVYVGANDGMLHAFAANVDKPATIVNEGINGGEERFAYVPLGVQPHLSQLTRQDYAHRFYVDGSPFTADVNVSGTWNTYLAGFLGAGGKGYFLLNVTDPAQFSTASPSSLVVLDRTDGADPDIGHIFSTPLRDASNKSRALQITRMNNGRWALVTGNGYNSTNENAVLLIQYLDGAREVKKIAATATVTPSGNGLSAPQLIDLNGDDTPDVAYAGDLTGRLWKFDLSNTDATQWKTATFGNGVATPLYVATDAGGNRQAITSAPVWRPHPNGGLMIAFGTGRNLTDADRARTDVDTLYGVYDNAVNELVPGPIVGGADPTTSTVSIGTGSAITTGRTSLVAQTFTENPAGSGFFKLSDNPVVYSGPSPKRGWFVDLPVTGERNLTHGDWFDGNLIEFKTTVPANGGDLTIEACEGGQPVNKSYTNIMNIVSGSAPRYGIYDVANNGTFSNTASRTGIENTATTVTNGSGTKKITIGASGSKLEQKLPPRIPLNPAWRQLQ